IRVCFLYTVQTTSYCLTSNIETPRDIAQKVTICMSAFNWNAKFWLNQVSKSEFFGEASLVDINETPLWGAGNERGPCLCLIHVTSNA
ncbi:hypothetical protein AFLA70_222g002042, partial [Aspergillus flavus AF70]